MRAVMIVLGIAVVGIVLSMLVGKPKDLTPLPQEREDQRRQAMNADASKTTTNPSATAEPAFTPPREGAVQTVLSVEGRGDILIEMYPKAAPKTVQQLTSLVKSGFYNGIKIHRVEPGFVVQAGDPQTKKMALDAPEIGQGGSGKSLPFEKNDLKNVKGSLSMALSPGDKESGDSQFYINLDYNKHLDGDYCVFGKVVQGMDIAEKIQRGDEIKSFTVK